MTFGMFVTVHAGPVRTDEPVPACGPFTEEDDSLTAG